MGARSFAMMLSSLEVLPGLETCFGRAGLVPSLARPAALGGLAQRCQLARDEGLEDFVRAGGLRARVVDPLVLAALEDFDFAFPAGGAVHLAHFLRDLPRHVGIELAHAHHAG